MDNNNKPLISLTNLKKYFPIKKTGLFQKEQLYVKANEDITLDIGVGETVGVVGESGCGKSTLGRVLLQLYPQTGGVTMYNGRTIQELAPKYVNYTLTHGNQMKAKYYALRDKADRLTKAEEDAGDNVTYNQAVEASQARSDVKKALADIAKIFGGFMTYDNLDEPAKLLKEQYELSVKLIAEKNDIKKLRLEHDLAKNSLKKRIKKVDDPAEQAKLEKARAKKKAKLDKIEARMAIEQADVDALEARIKEVRAEIGAEAAKHKDDANFQKYDAMNDNGIDLSRLTYNEIRLLRSDLQIIFQDPYSSLNPRMTIGQIIEEGLVTHGFFKAGSDSMKEHILQTMRNCGLQDYMLHRYPHQFSGGQRQRVSIARSLAVKPKFVVCDECVSALDVSIQSQIINLLQDLKEKEGLTYMFISHDLSVVKYISDRIAVMYLGNIVELATSDQIFADPRHPYTIALLSSIPTTELDHNTDDRIILEGNIPSPVNPPKGCKFHTRCYMATEKCSRIPPKAVEVEPGHTVACHFAERKVDGKGNYLFDTSFLSTDANKASEAE